MNERENPIVFAYYYNGEFQGFRSDTFNTISKDYAKVYSFSREQVDTVLDGVKSGCNRAGKALMELIRDREVSVINGEGSQFGDVLLEHVSKTEDMIRSWGEFELRVIPFPKAQEFQEFGEGDEWKRAQFIENLEAPIEVHKFKVVDFEN